jgi:hypothetical protein
MSESITIPHPESPCHVENLNSIALLKDQGFQGIDSSLEESLFEYGLAWLELPEEWLFVHRHHSMPKRFDRCTIAKGTDPIKEWNWVKWESFSETMGVNMEAWKSLPFPQQVADLFSYHGPEEIFGSSYWEGFAVEGKAQS